MLLPRFGVKAPASNKVSSYFVLPFSVRGWEVGKDLSTSRSSGVISTHLMAIPISP